MDLQMSLKFSKYQPKRLVQQKNESVIIPMTSKTQQTKFGF